MSPCTLEALQTPHLVLEPGHARQEPLQFHLVLDQDDEEDRIERVQCALVAGRAGVSAGPLEDRVEGALRLRVEAAPQVAPTIDLFVDDVAERGQRPAYAPTPSAASLRRAAKRDTSATASGKERTGEPDGPTRPSGGGRRPED